MNGGMGGQARRRGAVPGRGRWVGLVLGAFLLGAAPSPDTGIADAARAGDRQAVLDLIAQGADVSAARGDGTTALHFAAERGDEELVAILLDAGATVDPPTRIGHHTPLHLAARNGNGAVVRRLLAAGADPGLRTDPARITPLHLAAASGDAASVAALLEAGAEVDARESAWHQTPLVFAAHGNSVTAIELLVAAGAQVDALTRVDDLPTREAVDQQARAVRNRVLNEFREAEGGGPNWRPSPQQVQAAVAAARELQRSMEDAEGLQGEEEAGEEEVLGYTGLVGAMGGLTPLLHAVREGNAEATHALLDAGADINRPSAGDGTTPLLMSAINGHFDLGLELLARGADPNAASQAGATPLFAAINLQHHPRSRYPQPRAHERQEVGYLGFMEALLEAGADPNARLRKHLWYLNFTFEHLGVDTSGATAFWRAAYGTDVAAMRLLMAWGADPEIPTLRPPARQRGGYGGGDQGDASGLPPVPVGGPGVHAIHAASGVGYGEGFAANVHRHVPNGWLPSVRYLVEELGMDVNTRDHNGYTALHHAASRGDVDLILYLVQQGADVTVVSREGQTVADMANSPRQRISPFPRAVQLLESLGSHNNQNCVAC
jgi:uncharacterized protein